ncbi:hypothetical protein [Endozoicomonas lisbonensis]|uniref:Uncharacterized protein n=1 Tax=Endozoicomonas lisbonensis TaxID=3120522 RepID=A0ABV2SD20_9GAMM
METIDWNEYEEKEHVIAWFIVEAMTKAGFDRFGKFDNEKMEISMQINGIDVSFKETMEFLNTQLDDIKNRGFEHGKEVAGWEIKENIDKILGIET